MIKIHNSNDLTLEICKEIKKLAKEAKACKDSYVPFVKAHKKKDLEECVAIINGEYDWLLENEILPYDFVRNGRAVKYYSNGQKELECTYVNGKLHGKFERWHENGQKCEKTTYERDYVEKTFKSWYENGQKCSKYNYENGKLNGKRIHWHENGQKELECNYVNSKLLAIS